MSNPDFVIRQVLGPTQVFIVIVVAAFVIWLAAVVFAIIKKGSESDKDRVWKLTAAFGIILAALTLTIFRLSGPALGTLYIQSLYQLSPVGVSLVQSITLVTRVMTILYCIIAAVLLILVFVPTIRILPLSPRGQPAPPAADTHVSTPSASGAASETARSELTSVGGQQSSQPAA